MKIKHGALALVADGSRMLLLRNAGDEVYPDMRVIEHYAFENPPNRELMSDAPGVSHASGYPARTTFEEADPHQENEDRFALEAVKALSRSAQENPGDLIVVAPPHVLGVLRRHYDRTITARLTVEIDKDLTKHPVEEITRLIVAHRP